MNDRVIVAGEALVDLVLQPDGSLAGHPGGGPYNVARTLGRLGRDVAYLGALSSDAFGRRLRDELTADGVVLDHVQDTDLPTTLALAELDEHGGAQYRFYAEGTSAPALTAAELPSGIAAFVVGTLGLVWEPMAATLERCAAGLPDGVLLAVDPNCRPSATEDPGAYRARLHRLTARGGVVKASADDLAWLEPGRDVVDAARTLLGGVVLVTRGGDPALVVSAGEVREVPAIAVDVVDSIGAGDAFLGGFLTRWLEGGARDVADLDAVADAAAFATRVAARTCERAGADPPRAGEID